MTAFTSSSTRTSPRYETTGLAEGPARVLLPSQVLPWATLEQIALARAEDYRRAKPFPHVLLDGLFDEALLDEAVAELPIVARWARYDSANERKVVCSDVSAFGT